MSFCSRTIEWKHNSDVNHGPDFCYKCTKTECVAIVNAYIQL